MCVGFVLFCLFLFVWGVFCFWACDDRGIGLVLKSHKHCDGCPIWVMVCYNVRTYKRVSANRNKFSHDKF